MVNGGATAQLVKRDVSFSHTEAGMLPGDWQAVKLGEMLVRSPSYGINAAAIPYDLRLPAYIRITDITEDGRFNPEGRASVSHPNVEAYRLVDGDIVLARTGASTGKSYLYRRADGELVYAGFLIKISPDINKLLPAYLIYQMQTPLYWRWVKTNSMRSGQPGINGQQYASFTVPVPPTLREQQVIAEALSDADELIEGLEALIAKKRAIKQGVMQDLLSGRRRLPGFSCKWEERTFGEIFSFYPTATNSRADLNENGDAAYVHYGDIHTRFHDKLDFSRMSLPRVERRRCPNAEALRNGDWIMADASENLEGVAKSIEVVGLKQNEVAVSGLHTFLLRENNPTFAPGFKGHLGNAQGLRNQYLRVMTGMKVFGVSKAALSDLLIPIPEWKEQEAIRDVLDDMSAELACLEEKLLKARQIKQGMMQDLLTGRVRLV